MEKEIRIRSLQRSPGGHSHSHDSAIDSDMYEWETDHVDLDMVSISVVMLTKMSTNQNLDNNWNSLQLSFNLIF